MSVNRRTDIHIDINDEIESEASLSHYNWQQLVWKVLALQKRILRGPVCPNCECGVCEQDRKKIAHTAVKRS